MYIKEEKTRKEIRRERAAKRMWEEATKRGGLCPQDGFFHLPKSKKCVCTIYAVYSGEPARYIHSLLYLCILGAVAAAAAAALGGACCHHIGARGVSLQRERGERGRC
jgi:hypothetical protein